MVFKLCRKYVICAITHASLRIRRESDSRLVIFVMIAWTKSRNYLKGSMKMISFENTEVFGWEAAIRGMRNPMNSWEKSDSFRCGDIICGECPLFASDDDDEKCRKIKVGKLVIGENDLKLMQNLAKSGTDHSKFLRMITVTADITAPRYWWTEFDTYKVGTVRNSCSTMHKIHAKEFDIDDFSCEKMHVVSWETEEGESRSYDTSLVLDHVITALNIMRERYNATKDKDCWWQMIQLLPQSYNQRATVQLNYAVLRSIYHSDRKHHKLDEWRIGFMEWIESLPYSELITGAFF